MTTYTLIVRSGEVETTLILNENFLVGFDWECLDGEAMWGKPYKGKSFGRIISKGTILLTDSDTLHVSDGLSSGKKGTGYHNSVLDATFPNGSFDWEVK